MYDPVALGLEVHSVTHEEALVICPYHEDSRPSANFNMRSGLFYCYTCGAASNVKQIAKEYGVPIEKVSSGEAVTMLHGTPIKAKLSEWLTALAHAPLATTGEHRDYLKSRGVQAAQVATFEIRALPNAIAFPVGDYKGKVIGVNLRFLPSANAGRRYQYMGEPTKWWPHFAKYSEDLFVVEGAFGVLAADRAGIQAVTPMSASKAERIGNTLPVNRFRILFDNDDAGLIGAARLIVSSGMQGAVLLPGAQTDELSIDEWESQNKLRGTRNLQMIAKMAEDPDRARAAIRKALAKYERKQYRA